ncbi:hypothetical protein GW916_07680 [bacterium]|nr:hypothetical protein [bacterium]
MRTFDRFSWIRTRDGSPTLFHNEEGAAFRSQKGAFTESFHVFVKPALEFANKSASTDKPTDKPIRVLEFGLGPGTNWLLWTVFSSIDPNLNGREIQYVAIEKDTSSFEIGCQFWIDSCDDLPAMMSKSCYGEGQQENLLFPTSPELKSLLEIAKEKIQILPSLDNVADETTTTENGKFDICFFDPFGYDVNPEAYQAPALERLKSTLKPKSIAFSYACNSKFQRSLRDAGYNLATPYSGAHQLKRERIEFWPA